MTALTDLAAVKTEYDANTARAAVDALEPLSGIPTDAQNAALHTLYLANMKRQDLAAHRKALLTPGSAGPASWLPAPAAWGSGVSRYQEAHATGA